MFTHKIPIAIEYALIVLTIVMTSIAASFYCTNIHYDMLLDRKMDDIRSKVSDATKILSYFQKMEEDGNLNREQAQIEAIKILKAFHHDNDDYLWVNTYDGVMILHPNVAMIGKNLNDMTDARGNFLFHKFKDIALGEGSGYARYYWPKPSFTDPIEKVSYVSGFVQWQWIVGAGLYIDDIDEFSSKYFIKSLVATLSVGFFLIGLITIRYITIKKEINSIENALTDLSKGNFALQQRNDVHRNNPFYRTWQIILSVRKYNASLERNFLEHEAKKEKERQIFEKSVKSILSNCENNILSMWDEIKHKISQIKLSSNSLGNQIEETNQRANELLHNLDTETTHITDAKLYITNCRDIIAGCSANIEEIIMHYDYINTTAKSSLNMASQFTKAVEIDMHDAINILKSVSGHINLVDLILNDLVISGVAGDGKKDYQTISLETKSILQRVYDAVEKLTTNRDNYMALFPAIIEMQKSGIPVLDRWQREAPLANMKATEQSVSKLGEEMSTAIQTISGFGSFSHEIARTSAKQNSELIRISWCISDVISSMDKIIYNIDAALSEVHEHIRKPI
ncbi:MAG: cache domain-containing protein [Rhodospirillaceae bacterium]